MSARTITHAGRTMTVAAWAAELGVSRQVIYERLNCGWSSERIVTEPCIRRPTMQHRPGRVIELDGITMTVPQWAAHLGVGESVLYRRLKRESTAKALQPPRPKSRPRKHCVEIRKEDASA